MQKQIIFDVRVSPTGGSLRLTNVLLEVRESFCLFFFLFFMPYVPHPSTSMSANDSLEQLVWRLEILVANPFTIIDLLLFPKIQEALELSLRGKTG